MSTIMPEFQDWVTEKPLLIAGPCSAESAEQMIKIARALASMGIKIFRAGIWKPRTRPGMFEGIGVQGLCWLQQVKKETNMLTATEVATARHVYEALKYDVDMLWVGARTTVNPFAVQEIAEAVAGIDIPILMKNPVNPDIDLWMGSIERLYAKGLRKIGVIHRGFTDLKEKYYRNSPHWEVAIELKRRIPQLPIICDPSHIGGKRELIHELSQKALDLGFDGLIIEVHNDPDHALSDAKQQITPDAFHELLQNLLIRHPDPESPEVREILNNIRQHIDRCDDDLVELLDKRMKLAEEIGNLKKKNNLTVVQNKRWDEILQRRIEQGKELNMSSDFIYKVFEAIHEESILHQIRIMNTAHNH